MESMLSRDGFSCHGTFQEFKKRYDVLDKAAISTYIDTRQGLTPFHLVLDQLDSPNLETREKIVYLFQNLKRLGLDPNIKYSPRFKAMPEFLKWDNAPISHVLAYENFDLALFFLERAKKTGVTIDLNLKDKSGKTPLLFAIKLARAPIGLIQELITDENYNTPDQYGMTPLMLACALRRKDIMELLIQKKKQVIEKNSHVSLLEQRQQLLQFIYQKHPVSGKTLAHFAILRSGTLRDFSKDEPAYQETVLNILKEAGIEGFRDEHACWNCVTNSNREPLKIVKSSPGVSSLLSFSNQLVLSKTVYLSCKENLEGLIKLGVSEVTGMEHLQEKLKIFTGRSVVDVILSKTTDVLDYLASYDFDFSLKQTNGKGLLDYIRGLLLNSDNPSLVSKEDVNYLLPIANYLNKKISGALVKPDVIEIESEPLSNQHPIP